jgi:hypothetical protein
MEPEKQPLLENGNETFVFRQRLGKHVSTSTDTHETTELLLETVFSIRSVKVVIKKIIGATKLVACVEAGSNTSTVTLRVVGGDEKRIIESETVKYGRESNGTRTR